MTYSTNKKVSILVPIYGVEKYIERCARSLFEQTYEDLEYIFVDDCTPDKSIEILYNIIEQYPMRKPHVRIVKHERNRGLAAARNTAVDSCLTEFLMHVDSDDYINKEYVQKMVEQLTNDDVDIVNPTIHMILSAYVKRRIYPEIRIGKDYSLALAARMCPVRIAGPLIRKSLYTDNNISAQVGLNVGEDYHVTPRLAYFAKGIRISNESVYYYDCTNESSYTGSFNIKKTEQVLLSLNILKSFFAKKGTEFLQALSSAHAQILCRELINYSLSKGTLSDYKYLQKEVDTIDQTAIRTLPKYEQVIMKIRNRAILKYYVMTASYINRTFKKISAWIG